MQEALGCQLIIKHFLKTLTLAYPPGGHIYVVNENSNFPFDFVCYADPDNNLDAYNKKYKSVQLYRKAIEQLKDAKPIKRDRPKQTGVFAGPGGNIKKAKRGLG